MTGNISIVWVGTTPKVIICEPEMMREVLTGPPVFYAVKLLGQRERVSSPPAHYTFPASSVLWAGCLTIWMGFGPLLLPAQPIIMLDFWILCLLCGPNRAFQ